MSFMNRMANSSNRFQTDVKKVLCLCSAGLLRSPTLANVLHEEYGYNTRAAGVTTEYALVPVDDVLIEWADEVVCVEMDVFDAIGQQYQDKLKHKRVVVLAVPDMYEWNNPELRGIMSKQYKDAAIHEQAQNRENV